MYGSVYYNRKSSKISWSEYDETGKRHLKTKSWVPDFYIPKAPNLADEGYKSEDGTSLQRIVSDSWSNRRKLIKMYQESNNVKIYGSDLSPENKFILETWPGNIEENVPPIRYVFVDIETECEKGFPKVELADEKINLITVYSNIKKKFYTFGLGFDYVPTRTDVEYVKCDTEESLLRKFIKLLDLLETDVLSGWNSSGFDIPFIFNRCMRILDGIDLEFYNRWMNQESREQLEGEDGDEIKERWSKEHAKLNWTKKLSPFNQIEKKMSKSKDRFTKEMKDDVNYTIQGITDYDYLELYRQFSQGQRESYKLDDIAEYELKEKKLEFEGSIKSLYKNDWNKFVEYNIQDVNLLVKLENNLGFIALALGLSYKCHCQFKDNFGTVTKFETSVYNFLYKNKIIMRDDYNRTERLGTQEEGFEGAYVKDPVPGMYQWVLDFDVSSLYPSIMRGLNISYDTKILEIRESKKLQDFKEDDMVKIAWKSGKEEELSVKVVRELISSNKYAISSANVLFEDKEKKKGILVEMLDLWYAGRKSNKKKMGECTKKALEISKLGIDEETDGYVKITVDIGGEKKNKYLTKEQHEEYLECFRKEKIFYSRQWAEKILLNSIYGAVSTPFSRYYDRALSRSVTTSGQTILKENGKMLDDFYREEVYNRSVIKDNFKIRDDILVESVVVYQDTDSNYVSFEKVMNKIGIPDTFKDRLKMAKFFGAMTMKELEKFNKDFFPKTFNAPNTVFWEQELISDRSIFCKRKKYACHIVELNGFPPKPEKSLLKKGLDMVRSSTPKIFRKSLEESVMLILKENNQEKFNNYSMKVFEEFNTWDTETISLPKSCNNLKKFACEGIDFAKGSPGHMKAAIAYNYYIDKMKLDQYETIKEGERFKMIHLNDGNPYRIEAIGFIDKLPKEFEITQDMIDKKKHFELAYIQPMATILDSMGWKLPNFYKDSEDISEFFS